MARRKHPADKYIDGVLSGRVKTSRLTRLAVERQVADLKNGHKRGLVWNPAAGQRSIDFSEQFLHHSKGEWAGSPLLLEPWQQFRKMVLFGWYTEDGARRFRTSYVEVPRKNGKSTDAAGDGLFLFMADGEPGAEVYAAATKRDQARIVHSEAVRMVQASRGLSRRVVVHHNNMSIAKTASKFEPLSSDHDTLDGLNPHAAIIDELHAFKSPDLVEKIRTALGARRNPMLYYITTAGVANLSIGHSESRYARSVLEGVFKDDSYFAFVSTIDDGDDPFSPQTWEKANPNYGISVKARLLREAAARADKQAGMLNEFLRYHLNVWTSQSRRWINLVKWDECDICTSPNELAGEACYVGLDLSTTIDVTAAAWLFPPAGERKRWTVLMQFWIPDERILDRVQRDRVPYGVWAREGLLTVTPGAVVDYDFVRADLNAWAARFKVTEVGFDPWNATQLAVQLASDGFKCVEVRQGYRTLSEPTKFLEGLVVSNEIDHQKNPVLRWMASNVETLTDPAGNIKPAKDRSIEKIDGIVALVIAFSRAIVAKDESSIYDQRDLRVI